MGKPPANVAAIGDRVKLRGRDAIGILKHLSPTNWAVVGWDVHKAGPGIVHLHELEKLA